MFKYKHILDIISQKYIIASFAIQQNSAHGVCLLKTSRFFFKVGKMEHIINEINGYKLAQSNCNTPELVEFYSYDNEGAILYVYEQTVDYNRGLLCDSLNDNSDYNEFVKEFNTMLHQYSAGFNCKSMITPNSSYYKFIKDRLYKRFDKWYIQEKILFNKKLIIGNTSVDIQRILESVKMVMEQYIPTEGILMHGDPGDLNIGTKPVFFDLETYGYNPVDLEFATFFWNLFLGGAYFFPRYHSDKYFLHNHVYSQQPILTKLIINPHEHIVSEFTIQFNDKRLYALTESIKFFSRHMSFSQEVSSLIIFRILTILEPSNMKKEDVAIMLTVVAIIERRLRGGNVYDKTHELLQDIRKGKMLI